MNSLKNVFDEKYFEDGVRHRVSAYENYRWMPERTIREASSIINNIKFDTLVLDCEGAFYYILMDTPEILTNINLIIMENDYLDKSHKTYIDDILKNHQFNTIFTEGGGWGPCANNFYEVWAKTGHS